MASGFALEAELAGLTWSLLDELILYDPFLLHHAGQRKGAGSSAQSPRPVSAPDQPKRFGRQRPRRLTNVALLHHFYNQIILGLGAEDATSIRLAGGGYPKQPN